MAGKRINRRLEQKIEDLAKQNTQYDSQLALWKQMVNNRKTIDEQREKETAFTNSPLAKAAYNVAANPERVSFKDRSTLDTFFNRDLGVLEQDSQREYLRRIQQLVGTGTQAMNNTQTLTNDQIKATSDLKRWMIDTEVNAGLEGMTFDKYLETYPVEKQRRDQFLNASGLTELPTEDKIQPVVQKAEAGSKKNAQDTFQQNQDKLNKYITWLSSVEEDAVRNGYEGDMASWLSGQGRYWNDYLQGDAELLEGKEMYDRVKTGVSLSPELSAIHEDNLNAYQGTPSRLDSDWADELLTSGRNTEWLELWNKDYNAQLKEYNALKDMVQYGTFGDASDSAMETAKRKLEHAETRLNNLQYVWVLGKPDYPELSQTDTAMYETDGQYRAVNDPEYARELAYEDAYNGITPTVHHLGYLMEERERGIYNYLYKEQGKSVAEAYLNSIYDRLKYTYARVQAAYDQEFATEHPILSNAATVAAKVSPQKLGQTAVQVGAALTGADISPYDTAYQIDRTTGTIRGTTQENIKSDFGDWVYGTGMSMLDNVAAMAAGLGNPAASGLWMGANVFGSESYDMLSRGADMQDASTKAGIAAAVEAITEHIGFDNILKSWGAGSVGNYSQLMTQFLKNFVSGAMEETPGNFVDDAVESWLMGDESKRQTRISELAQSGMNPEDAMAQADKEFLVDTALEILGGGLAEGLMGSASYGTNAYLTGRQLQKDKVDVDLIDIAKQMPEGSKSRRAAEMVERTKSKMSTATLYNSLREEMPQQSQQTLDNITAAGLVRQLKKDGETGDVDTIVKSVMKVLRGEKLTDAESEAVAKSSKGIDMMDRMSRVSHRDNAEIKAYNEAYNAGYYGQEAVEGMNRQYYKAGVEAAQKAEETRLARVGKAGVKGGRVSYIGTAVTDADVRMTNAMPMDTNTMSRLNQQQRDAVQALKTISQVTGIQFALYEGQADESGNITIENGKFDSATNTIYLDLNSGRNRADQGVVNYAIMRTAAHEMTHFIEKNSATGYASLKTFIQDELIARGQDMAALVRGKQEIAERQGRMLTREAATAEVIADACEMMLKDSQAIHRLAQKDQGLFKKVRGFLSNLLNKIRRALEGVDATHAEAEALREAGKYIEGLQKLWDDALVEAVETAKGVGQTAENTENSLEPTAQFELRAPMEQRKDGLIAVHNLTFNKLLDTLELGGFPMPSIAVVKASQGHDMYGDYSVVFGPETIDPKADKANRVYGNDAWTPTFLSVETEVDSNAMYRLEKEIEAAAQKVDPVFRNQSRTFFGNFSGYAVTDKKIDDLSYSAWNNAGMVAAYLSEQGKTVNVLETQVNEERGYKPERAEQYDRILDIMDVQDYSSMSTNELLNTYGDRLAEVSDLLERMNARWKEGDRRSGVAMSRIIKEAVAYEKSGRDVSEKVRTVKDYYATEDAMREMADRDDFNRWLEEKMSGILGQKGIYNGKDLFTLSGNRRTFRQTHYDYTVENVVRAMLQEEESSIPAVDASGLKAAASTRYRSLDEIRADSYRLGKVSDGEFNAIMAKADNDLNDFFNEIGALGYDAQEDAGNLLVTAAKRKLGAKGIADLFKAHGYKKATLRAGKIAESVIRQVQTIPTGYLEAKPARVVSFDEVRMVVAPDNMPVKLANALAERGIPYTTYDGSTEGRLEKLNGVENVQFSPRELNDPQLKKDARVVTDSDVKAMLQACKADTASNDRSKDKSYIPIRKNTPQYLLSIADARQAPLVMQVLKARQAMAPENMKFGSSHGHSMTPDEIVRCINLLEQPEYVAYDTVGDRAAVVVTSPVDGRATVLCFDFEQNKNRDTMSGYNGGMYNVVVTIFKRPDMENAVEYLERGGYIEKTLGEEASATVAPALSNQEFLKKIIPQSSDFDNPQEEKFSPRETTTEELTRQFMENMQPTERMTEGEKWLLNKYQTTRAELIDAENKATAEDDKAASATARDDRVKAEINARTYRNKAERLRKSLRDMEKADGFATLMRTSEQVVQRFLASDDVTRAAGASDDLDLQLSDLQKDLQKVAQRIRTAENAQRSAFARGLFDQKALNMAGNNIRKAFNTSMTGKTIADRLALAYAELYAAEDAGATQRFTEALRTLAEDVLRYSKHRYHSPVLADLRQNLGGSISLSDAQKQELKNAGISMTDFRRVVGSVVNVSDNGSSLSSIVSSAEYYGSGIIAQLSSADSEGDMILRLYETIRNEKAKEQANALEGMSESESLSYTMAEIMEQSNFPMTENAETVQAMRSALLEGAKRNKAIADKVDNAIRTAQDARKRAGAFWRNVAAVENTAREAIDYYRAVDEQRRLMEEQEIIQQMRSKAYQKLHETQAVRHLSEQSAAKARHIQRVVKRLDNLMRHETDYKNVPEDLKSFVSDVMEIFGRGYNNMVWTKQQADKIVAVYSLMKNTDGPYAELAPFYDEDMLNTLQALGEWAKRHEELSRGKGMNHLQRAQLRYAMNEAVADLVDHVNTIVKNSRDMFVAGRKQKFAAISAAVRDELMKQPDHVELAGKPGDVVRWMDDAIRTGNITPVYFFDQLGNSELKTLFNDFRQGQDEYGFEMANARATFQQHRETYHYDAWKDAEALTLKTQQGHEISLNKEQALWLYATWKREHSNPIAATEHLTYGGFVYETKQDPVKSSKHLPTVKPNTTGHQIREADMAKVNAYLTDEQKAYADAMVGFMSSDMAALGNRVSMEMFGIEKYREKYYFPYKTVSDQLYQSSTAGSTATADDSRMKHGSFTHALTRKARTALVMGNFSDVVANHVSQMITYSSFVVPIENMNRVMNHKFETDDGGITTMRSLLRQKHGENALKYIETFIRDMNGGPRGAERSQFGKFVSLFKKAAVSASLSVALQQPSAILRASVMVNPKYLMTAVGSKLDFEQLTQYSGVAVVKQMGRFDTNVGQSTREWLLDDNQKKLSLWQKAKQALTPKEWEKFKNRWSAITTGLPSKMDEWSWALLWNAVKREQADLHKDMDTSSTEFLMLCGERFNDVVDHTQVYDSVLARSQVMRSKSELNQMATSFMSEPTLTMNILYDAFANKHHPNRPQRIKNATLSVLASSMAAAIGSALISAWNKDDDDRTAFEKLLNKTQSAFLDNMNPLNSLPWLRDIYSILQGYEVERADMSLFTDIVNSVQRISSGKYTGWKAVEELGGSIANLFGVPAKNVMRDLRRIYNMATSDWSAPTQTGLQAALTPWWDDKMTANYDRIVGAYADKDTARAADITEYLKTVKGKKDDDIRSGVKSAAKERVKAGSMTSEEATELLVRAYPQDMNANDLYWEFDKLDAQMNGELADGENYSKYNDFYEAVETGVNLKAEIQRYLDNGVDKETLSNQISKKFKPQLIDLYETDKTEASKLQARILTAYEVLGYDREKKLKDVKKWYE